MVMLKKSTQSARAETSAGLSVQSSFVGSVKVEVGECRRLGVCDVPMEATEARFLFTAVDNQ